MSTRNYPKRTRNLLVGVIGLIILFPIIIFLIFGADASFWVFFILFLALFIPISWIIISKLSGPAQKRCPNCNSPVSDYSETCHNCGFRLLISCPQCEKIIRSDAIFCPVCGFQLRAEMIRPSINALKTTFQGSKKGNLVICPTCGSKLEKAENLRYCEYCGTKLP
jgi:predicted amidophosphoribosyltransferase